MVTINYAFREVVSKIVYYGPGLSGKTTNLQYVFKKVPAQTRGEMISLATEADRTLYFDFLPINLGTIQGFATKFQLYTVPGQVFYNATRKLVLRGVDGLVFVADSQLAKMDENIESFNNLNDNLSEYGLKYEEIPLIIQYNKRDLPAIAPVEQLQSILNPGKVPYFEAVASEGIGVFDTLKAICKLVLDQSRQETQDEPAGQKIRAVPTPGVKPVEEVKAAVAMTPEKIEEQEPQLAAMADVPIEQKQASEKETPIPPKTLNDSGSFRPEVTIMADSSDDTSGTTSTDQNVQQVRMGMEDFQTGKIRKEAVVEPVLDESAIEKQDISMTIEPAVNEAEQKTPPASPKPFIPGFDIEESSGDAGTVVDSDLKANIALDEPLQTGETGDMEVSQVVEEGKKSGLQADTEESTAPEVPPERDEKKEQGILKEMLGPDKPGKLLKTGETKEEVKTLGQPPPIQKPIMQGMKKQKSKGKSSLFGWMKKLGRKQGGG